MSETVTPQGKFTLSQIQEELQPEVEKLENEDELLAQLHGQKGWETLKAKIESRIESLDVATIQNISDMEEVELYGFKCMAKDLITAQLKGIIKDVEETYKFLQDKKDKPNE